MAAKINISEPALRPILWAYVEHYDDVFADPSPSDDWRKRGFAAYRDRVMDMVDGQGKMSTETLNTVLSAFLDDDLHPVDKKRLVALDSTVSDPRWKTLLKTVEEHPETATSTFTELLRHEPYVGVESFVEWFTSDRIRSIDAESVPMMSAPSPAGRVGMATTLLMALHPKQYVSYQYKPHRQFFARYTDYMVAISSNVDIVAQYERINDAAARIMNMLEEFSNAPDMIDVRNIIRNHGPLEERVDSDEMRSPPPDVGPRGANTTAGDRSAPEKTSGSEGRDNSKGGDADSPVVEGRVVASELYESFVLFTNVVDTVAGAGEQQQTYLTELKQRVDRYGTIQSEGVSHFMRDYRDKFGKGGYLRADEFGAISVASLPEYDVAVDIPSVCPIAPDSGEQLPIQVDSEAQLDEALELLAEFPDNPETEASASSPDRAEMGQLGRTDDPTTESELIRQGLKRSAVRALAEAVAAGDEGVPLLDDDLAEEFEPLLSDPNDSVRRDALRTLVTISRSEPGAVVELRGRLLELLKHGSLTNRAAALDILAFIGDTATTNVDDTDLLVAVDYWEEVETSSGADVDVRIKGWANRYADLFGADERTIRSDLSDLVGAGITPQEASQVMRYRHGDGAPEDAAAVDALAPVNVVSAYRLVEAGYETASDVAAAGSLNIDGLAEDRADEIEAAATAYQPGKPLDTDRTDAEVIGASDAEDDDRPEGPDSATSKASASDASPEDLGPTGRSVVSERYALLRQFNHTLLSVIARGIGDEDEMKAYKKAVDAARNEAGERQSEAENSIRDYRDAFGDGDRVTDFRAVPTASPRQKDRERYRTHDVDADELPATVPAAPGPKDPLPVVVTSKSERERAEELLDDFMTEV